MAAGELDGSVQDRVTDAPVPAADAADVVFAVAKYGRFVPTSVAVKDVTSNGAGAPDPLIPVFLPVAIFPLFLVYQIFIMRTNLRVTPMNLLLF